MIQIIIIPLLSSKSKTFKNIKNQILQMMMKFKTKKEEKKYYIRKSFYDEWENLCYEWVTSGGREMTEKEIRRCKRTKLFRQLGVNNFDY